MNLTRLSVILNKWAEKLPEHYTIYQCDGRVVFQLRGVAGALPNDWAICYLTYRGLCDGVEIAKLSVRIRQSTDEATFGAALDLGLIDLQRYVACL